MCHRLRRLVTYRATVTLRPALLLAMIAVDVIWRLLVQPTVKGVSPGTLAELLDVTTGVILFLLMIGLAVTAFQRADEDGA